MGETNTGVSEKASKKIDAVMKLSTIFDPDREVLYPRFQVEELKLGRVLGRGGFCVVSEIESFQLKDEVITEEAKQNNLDLANQKHRRADLHDRVKKEGEARYAIKTLLPELKDDEEELEKGIIDLAIEAKFLCVLEHPHIIKMRGLCVGDMKIPGYFLVLDKLYDTFDQKLKKWKFAEKKLSGMMSKLKDKKGKKKNEFFAEKLNCAYDLASAVRFLHDNNIIYRDLKPDNIGFDVRDEPKIFDLGLAKELHPENELDDGNYKLTGWTGSMKYMAPEVAHMKPYNLSADVYSFGIVLWQVVSCDEPFLKYTRKMIETYVYDKGYRPKLNPKWRKVWSNLITSCWDPESLKRPDFEEIMEKLREEVYSLVEEDGYDIDLDASSRSRSGN